MQAGTSLGPFLIGEELGQGGMATVYKAFQPSLRRQVAVKVLSEFLAREKGFRERFETEAVSVANLAHPNIPAVYDYGEAESVTYIATQFLEGGTLEARLGSSLPVAEVVRLLGPIASALDYAHAQGVLHRDVKPSNIMLTGHGTPMLTDFGLARIMESDKRLTQTGAAMGTPEYMAPEICAGGEASRASDLYALAVVAYEMLTGRVPLTSATPMGVIVAQVRDHPPSPSSLNPSLAGPIEAALLRGLAKEPAERFPSCAEFVSALQQPAGAGVVPGPLKPATRAIRTEPAPRTRPEPRARSAPRRWPLRPVALISIAVLLLALAATAYLVQSRAPTRQPAAVATVTGTPGPGTVAQVAGDGSCGFGGDSGPALRARICAPESAIAVDAKGDLYLADRGNNRVRMVDPSGLITTIGGTGAAGSSGDGGPASQAQLDSPSAIAIAGTGTIYVVEGGAKRIRVIDKGGIITTVINGAAAACGPTAVICVQGGSVTALAVDGSGNLWVATGDRIWRVVLSGNSFSGTALIGQGGASDPGLNRVDSLAFGPDGSLYFGDAGVQTPTTHLTAPTVRKLTPAAGSAVGANSTLSTVAGTGAAGFSGDGGPGGSAQLSGPRGIVIDGRGRVYFADSFNNRVRRVDAAGVISTVAGNGKVGAPANGLAAISSPLDYPTGLALGAGGDLYVGQTNRIVRLVAVAA